MCHLNRSTQYEDNRLGLGGIMVELNLWAESGGASKCVCVYEEGQDECVCVCCKCVYPEGEENCVCVPCESKQGHKEE